MIYPEFQLKQLIKYWRNSLADEALAGLKGLTFPVRVPIKQLKSGILNPEDVEKLQAKWVKHKEDSKDQRFKTTTAAIEAVPVIILSHGFSPVHEHGQIRGKDQESVYILHIPALLQPSGELVRNEQSSPWIGRQYLHPSQHADGSELLLSDVSVQDEWLSKNPLEGLSWADYIKQCDTLAKTIIGGHSLDNFVSLDDALIDIAVSTDNYSLALMRLYDDLWELKSTPKLLERICYGRSDKFTVDQSLRVNQLDSIRGMMSSSYGLAPNQADALVAFSRHQYGEVLAVSGPPGTGKTTLLHSVIATEVIKAAIAGGEPSVIVGTSTNNRAVMNIVRSLNDILHQNLSSEHLIWASRWIEDCDSYGLYFPTNEENTNLALSNGHKIAFRKQQKGKRKNPWDGFPEREMDEVFVERARVNWLEFYAKSYPQQNVETLEDALDNLRKNIQTAYKRINGIKNVVLRYEELKKWWVDTTNNVSRSEFVQRESARLSEAIKAAQDKALEAKLLMAEACVRLDIEKVEVEKKRQLAKERFEQQEALITEKLCLASKVKKALVPDGLLEHVADAFNLTKYLFASNKASRVFDVVSQDPKLREMFADVLTRADNQALINKAQDVISNTTSELAVLNQELSRTELIAKQAFDSARVVLLEAEKKSKLAAKVVEQAINNKTTRLKELEDKDVAYQEAKQQLKITHSKLIELIDERFCKPNLDFLKDNEVPSLNSIDNLLDISWRHMAFQLAMRYWEGRWIIAAEDVQNGVMNNNNGEDAVKARFRRWCMLTPCLVTTANSIANIFQFISKSGSDEFKKNYLYDYIDLLIMDESGQVAPHVGAAAFALARKAFVVGDIYQIEPVVKISRGNDHGNAIRQGLGRLWNDSDPITPHSVSSSRSSAIQGSVMLLAQGASYAISAGQEDTPSIFLSEHRRCRKDIINFCNKLVYRGRLNPLRKEPISELPLSPMMWAHVTGVTKHENNSRSNDIEAQTIAQWIFENADSWIARYNMPIEKIVAIVTPFRAQEEAIQKRLKRYGGRFDNVTAGTVHKLQGDEKPVVIFSPTYNADFMNEAFFDQKPNMLNVAVSRAKDAFVVIGDMRLFRDRGQTPSSLLGRCLFADQNNELTDIEVSHHISAPMRIDAERIATLEGHRALLRNALLSASSSLPVVIVSPWITLRAIEDDRLEELVYNAVKKRGAKVWIIIDGELSMRNSNHGAEEAINLLKNAGATVCKVQNLHSKTLIVGHKEITEGSFNWLSAQRNPNGSYVRYESSWKVTGKFAEQPIQSALNDFETMGVSLFNEMSSRVLAQT